MLVDHLGLLNSKVVVHCARTRLQMALLEMFFTFSPLNIGCLYKDGGEVKLEN